jgi:hypothetical protein
VAKRHVNLGAAMADILGLPEDVDRGAMFGAAIGARRDPQFLPKAKLWLKGKPCAYCNAPADEAHHLYPYWWFPSMEMDERFWLPVCRRGQDHHLHLAHLGDFELFDVLAREHAAIFKFSRRMCRMIVRMTREAERKPKSRYELELMLAELAAVA